MIRINGGPLDGKLVPLDDVYLWMLKPEAYGYVVSEDTDEEGCALLENVEINYDEDFFGTIQSVGGTLWDDDDEDDDYDSE